jgi:hypothetical protein
VTLVSWGPAQAGAAQAGEVLVASGQCFVESGGKRTELKLGDAVNVGDTIDVQNGARLKLHMSDGSVISVASSSRLTIRGYSHDDRSQQRDADLLLSSGLIRAVVTPFSGPSHFEVDTLTGVAAVRSTDWFVEAREDMTQVGVLTGTVTLTSVATGTEVTVPARWGAKVNGARDPVPPRVWLKSEFDNNIARTAAN